MPGILNGIKKILLILLAGGAIGFTLLFLVYLLPTERMMQNARASIEIFEKEGTHPQTVFGYRATTLDNYTDAWMIRNAFYDGNESALQKCLHVYYYGYTGPQEKNVCESVIDYLKGIGEYERASYIEYWHGYLIFLKPLLCLFDYGDIREILKFITLLLVFYLCVLLERKNMARFIPAFAAAMICVEFHNAGMSMQYVSVFLIAMIFSALILKENSAAMDLSKAGLFFLVIGMCTSYFDFLTYPVFTLGIPLLFWVLCMSKARPDANLPVLVIRNGIYWAVGYVGMWAQKWILYTIITGENLIAIAIRTVIYRSGGEAMGEQRGYFETAFRNINVLCKYPYVLAVLAAIIFLLLVNRQENPAGSKKTLLSYLFIATLPFWWYRISINHSYIHDYMTYKSLSISVFAGICAVGEIKNLIKKQNNF